MTWHVSLEDLDSKSALLFAAGGVWGLALPRRGFITHPLIADTSSKAHSLTSFSPTRIPPFLFQ